MENNFIQDKFHWLYSAGFFIILALPVLLLPPYFFPAEWIKTIIFRSVLAIILFLFLYQFLRKKDEISLPNLRNNRIIWALGGLFAVFLLASIFSVDPHFSFWGSPYRGGGFVTFTFYFIFAILSFFLFKKDSLANSGLSWKKAWIFSIFIGVLVSLVAIFQYYGLFSSVFAPAPSGPSSAMGNPILLAIYLLLLFFPTLSFAIREKNIKLKLFYAFSLLLFLFAILVSGSRAAYFGIVVGILYFLLLYPKKFTKIKILTAIFLLIVVAVVFYVNAFKTYPQALQKNKIFQTLEGRLSIKKALNDERYKAWQTALKEIGDKPVLGWGPENLAVGFDKNYDPLVTGSPWWDKAHNVFLQIGAETGILGIIAYLLLIIALFWQLQKHKKNNENSLIMFGLQTTLIGYLVANFFSFDSFSTYLIFFLIIGYSLHLTLQNDAQSEMPANEKNKFWKSALIFVLFCILIIFLWQYNLTPFFINAKINQANDFVNQKQCDQAFNLMDSDLQQHSFLDSYAMMQYVEFEKICSGFYPQNTLSYAKRGIEIINEAIKIQPLYTRYWIWLGNLTTTLANQESNLTTKNNLINQANYYYNKATQLAPRHQEILTGEAELQITADNYKSAKDYSEKCIALNPALGDCYFYLALSQIYLKDNINANKNLQTALEKGYSINSEASLDQLVNAYGSSSVLDFQNLATILEKLIKINPNNAQYHSILASVYAKLGEYDKARQEAMTVLQLSPASKQNVEQFLKTLP